jgi:hypothetical protein
MRHTPEVASRKKLATALVLFALTMAPELLWLGAHALEHHADHVDLGPAHPGHGGLRELAEILVHGHHHPPGVPDHRHPSLSSSAVRNEVPRSHEVVGASRAAAPVAALALDSRSSSVWPLARLAGESPPLLYSLCTL